MSKKYPENKETINNFVAIRDWRPDEQPRERLMSSGPESLSDAELIAILLGGGTVGLSAVDLARKMLKDFESITNLANRDYSEFKKYEGIGPAKAVTIAAAFELSRRIKISSFEDKKIFRSPDELGNYYILKFRDVRIEYFYVLLLNSSNQVFREVLVSKGLLNSSLVHPREVFRLAITESASSIALLHNHPSGNAEPSKEDILITNQLVDAGKHIDIKVLDHIIIAGNNFTSFAKRGLI